MPGDTEKLYKTASVLGITAFCMGPFYSRLGVSASLVIKSAGLFMLHEYGKNQPGKLAPNSIYSLFGPKAGNAFENVLKGGESLVDSIVPPAKK